ncbi:MAG TPA: MIP family channel protein [Chloroflexota bacterium]|jgi:MIP family channel proteins
MSSDDMRAVAAEFFATLLFVFLGLGSIYASGVTAAGATLTADKLLVIALGHGLAIAVLAWASGHVSGGHINPAVTFAAWITGKISLMKGIAYIIAQLVGGSIGGFLIMYATGAGKGLGVHGLSGVGGDPVRGIIIEIVLTFVLVGVIFMTAMHPRGPGNVAPLAIGLAVLIDHLVGVPLTGASMNPARSFGAAIASSAWENQWVYWVGPLIGAAIAGLIAHHFFLKGELLSTDVLETH